MTATPSATLVALATNTPNPSPLIDTLSSVTNLSPSTVNTLIDLTPLTIVVTMTIGLTQLIKTMDNENKLVRFYPTISFIIGLALALLVFHVAVPTAIVTALAASGSWEVGKRTIAGIVPTNYVKLESATPKDNELATPNFPEPPPMGETADMLHPEIDDDSLDKS